jgi:hypothetical protein
MRMHVDDRSARAPCPNALPTRDADAPRATSNPEDGAIALDAGSRTGAAGHAWPL